MDRNLNIAAIEDNVIWGDRKANLEQLQKNLDHVPAATDIVILPEMFSTGFITDKRQALSLAERNTEETIVQLQKIASQRRLAIAASFIARTAGQVYNRALFVEPSGETTFYDKRHLFTMAGEAGVYRPGTSPTPTLRFRGWNVRLLVCYDLRFPVWCRNTEGASCDLMIFVANWPKPRQSAWTTLLQARAIENLCYVCGANRSGTDPAGIDYSAGSSVVVDYKGNIVAGGKSDSGNVNIVSATLDIERLRNFRDKFPAWKDADNFAVEI